VEGTVANGPRCTGCRAPLTAGGLLCIQCGTENDASVVANALGPPAAAPPSDPRLGFRHPRDEGSTWFFVVAILGALLLAGGIMAFLLYF
jgi:hypothetical protein